jgi:hypothetical protein
MGFLTLIILLLLFTWIIFKLTSFSTLNKKDALFAWGIKILIGGFFMYMFSYNYSTNGNVQLDVGNFMKDSKVLAEYGRNNPLGYLKLLVGIDADDPTVLTSELADTQIWDYGLNGDLLNDNRLIIRINSIIHFISFGNIWVHALVFSFLSFLGILLIFKSFAAKVKHKRLMFFTLLLSPSIAFWGSGVSKEAIFILAFGLFVHALVSLHRKVNFKTLLLLSLSIALLLVNKTHIGLVIVPIASIFFLANKTGFNKKVGLVFTGLIVGGFLVFCFTSQKINVIERISSKQSDFMNLAQGGIFFITDSSFCSFDYSTLSNFDYQREEKLISVNKTTKGEYKPFGEREFYPFSIPSSAKKYEVYLLVPPSETYISTTKINGSLLQLIKNTPAALFNVLIRPLPTDRGSNFKYLIFLENIAFITLLILAFTRRRILNENEKLWLFYLFLSAAVLTLVIGWTTPVIGAVVRYKMAPQLLLLLSAFIIMKPSNQVKT